MDYCKITLKNFLRFLILILCLSDASAASWDTSPRVWGSAEYLYWWVQNSPIDVPLMTQNNNPNAFGIINEPGTEIIFGAGSNRNSFNFGGLNGARVTLGGWLDNSCQYGLESSGFAFPQSKSSFTASSLDGNIPVLNIPFFSIGTGENVLVFKHPNTATVSDTFKPWGFEVNGLYNLNKQVNFPIVLLTGFRYMNLTENFNLQDSIFGLPQIPNSVLNVKDHFSTKNNFYGLQMGARTHYLYRRLTFDLTATIAAGDNYQKLIINGQTNVDNTRIIQAMGLFAEPSNIGTFTKNKFAFIPELRAKVAYNLCRNLRPFVTYDSFYIYNIIRPGKEIDRNINLSQNPLIGGSGVLIGPSSPSPKFNNTGMWMQGLSVGLEVMF